MNNSKMQYSSCDTLTYRAGGVYGFESISSFCSNILEGTGGKYLSSALEFCGLENSFFLQQKQSIYNCRTICEDCSDICVASYGSKCNSECSSNQINFCGDTNLSYDEHICRCQCDVFRDNTTNKKIPFLDKQITQFHKLSLIKEPP